MFNIYKELNIMINYIEENILEDIDIKVLARITGLNVNALKNVFYCLTGITINEYIRLRRLSLSVSDIIKGESITSIAYKYLYNSPSSYNRAFKKYEGVTPRDLKNNNKELKLFNKIIFNENIKDYNIDYKIYKNKEMVLYGISNIVNLDKKVFEIPEVWKKVKNNYSKFVDNKHYGFLKRINDKEGIYYCLLEEYFENFQKIEFPKCDYFAIKVFSFEAKKIIKDINKGLNEYIKALNYQRLNLPNIEVYYDDYVEILIPIT